MAQVGALGDIVFQVSADAIKTINNVVWSGSARYAENKRHLGNTVVEFTGSEADTLSFDMVLSLYLGVDPMEDIQKIKAHERAGTALPLVLGERSIGSYKWVIKSHKVQMETFDGHGNVTGATVSVELLEYAKSR